MQKFSRSHLANSSHGSFVSKRASLRLLFSLSLFLSLAVFFLATTPNVAKADPKSDLIQAKARLDELNTKLQTVDKQLFDLSGKLETTRSKTVATERSIDETKEKLSEKRTQLLKRVRSDYKSGFAGILKILLNTSSLQEIIDGIYYSNKISEHEGRIISSVKEDQDRLEKLSKDLVTQQETIKASLSEANTLNEKYTQELNEAKKYYDELDAKVKEQLAEEARKKAAEEEAKRQEAARQAAEQQAREEAERVSSPNIITRFDEGSNNSKPVNTPPVPENTNNAAQRQKVISLAKQYLGVPYVWGGTSPSGFDCSGLTQYVFRQIGIHLNRVDVDQRAQIRNFKPVSQLLPGDLVWKPGHIGIYLGGGLVIHAPTFNQTVKIVPIGWLNFVGGGWPSGAPGA